MKQGILYDRLEDQGGDMKIEHTVRNVHDKINRIAKAHILETHIDRSVFDLVFYSGNCIFPAQCKLVKKGQVTDCGSCL